MLIKNTSSERNLNLVFFKSDTSFSFMSIAYFYVPVVYSIFVGTRFFYIITDTCACAKKMFCCLFKTAPASVCLNIETCTSPLISRPLFFRNKTCLPQACFCFGIVILTIKRRNTTNTVLFGKEPTQPTA